MNNYTANTPPIESEKTKLSLNDKLLAANTKVTQNNKPTTTLSQAFPSSSFSNDSTTSTNPPQNTNQTKSFAETTANYVLPKMDQAIVINSIDGIKQIQYIIALGNITDPSNIISASRISNNRFCIFLKNKQTVEDLITNHPAIYIDNLKLPIRKLINPSKRIILSNVYPAIANDIITEALEKLDIKVTSPITTLKAGFHLDKFAHITSFRRQLYINPDDYTKLPGSITVSSDNTTYRIFITDDTVTCFLCKKPGHLSSSCKNILFISKSPEQMEHLNNQSEIDTPTLQTTANTPTSNKSHMQELKQNDQQTNNVSTLETLESQAPKKRPAPLSSCPSSPQSPNPLLENTATKDIISTQDKTKNNKSNKKAKNRSSSTSSLQSTTDYIDEQLEIVSDIFTQNEDSLPNSTTFRYIIENFTNKNVNIHDLCKETGTNAFDLLKIAEKIKPLLTDRKLKIKITKLSNLLFQSMPNSENLPPSQ